MKKIYLMVASLFLSVGLMAQTTHTTLTSHFASALTNPQAPAIGAYSWSGGNGYVSGTDGYGDVACVQMFNDTSGVTGTGTIDSLKVYIAKYFNTSTSGTYKLTVWDDNNGAPGNVIASQTLNLADIDTTQAGVNIIMTSPTAAGGLYNVAVKFTGAQIPANKIFWAGVEYPTTAAAGDTIVVLTSTGNTFPGSATHSGSIDGTGAFYAYTASGVPQIANAIFPVVTMDNSTSGIIENLQSNTVLYPNPSENVVNINFGSDVVNSVNVLNINGQVVAQTNVNNGKVQINVSSLESGMYLYQAIDASGAILMTNKFIRK